MTIEDDIAFLERAPVLRTLGNGALRILAIGAESYSVQSGEALFAAGDATDCAYLVQRGSFSLRADRVNDQELIAGPGTLLGESALLAETLRPATATAREACIVLRISRTMFIKMLESYPDAAQRLRDMIAARSDQYTRDMQGVRAALSRDSEPR
jgi:CRP-like cAMP-binding protein